MPTVVEVLLLFPLENRALEQNRPGGAAAALVIVLDDSNEADGVHRILIALDVDDRLPDPLDRRLNHHVDLYLRHGSPRLPVLRSHPDRATAAAHARRSWGSYPPSTRSTSSRRKERRRPRSRAGADRQARGRAR